MITTANAPALLLPGLRKVFGAPAKVEEEWKKIFTTYQSKMAYERDIMMSYLSPAGIKDEGQAVQSGDMGQRYTSYYYHKTVAQSFTITEEALEDNLYSSDFTRGAESLRNSLATAKDMLAANIFNNAFDPNYEWGDGQALCSDSHPMDNGSFSNVLTSAGTYVDFSEAALEEMIIKIEKFRRQNGMFTNSKPDLLIIPTELMFAARRIMESEFQPDTANNGINPLHGNRYFKRGVVVNRYITNGSSFFVVTNVADGFKHFQRSGFKTSSYVDGETDNIRFKAKERYSFGVSDPQAVIGSQGV